MLAAFLLGATLGGATAGTIAWRWAPRAHPGSLERPPRTDARTELEEWARGREQVLVALGRGRILGFEELRTQLRPAPTDAELADWLAALLTEGSVTARWDRHGRPGFAEVARPTDPAPRIVLDPGPLAALEADRAVGSEADAPDHSGSRPTRS